MSDELQRRLRDLGREPLDGGAELSVDTLLTRVHRGRAVRATVYGTVGAAAAVAVVVSGMSLVGQDPQPPAEPAITPAPSPAPDRPSPDRPPVVLPTGDAALPWGECGSLIDAPPPAPLAVDRTLTTAVLDPTVEAGSGLGVEATLWGGERFVSDALTAEHGPRFAVTRDGVVVAVGDLFGDPANHPVVLDHTGVSVRGELVLAVCDPVAQTGDEVSAGHALPAGEYQLFALADVVHLPVQVESWPDRTAAAAAPYVGMAGSESLTVVSDPVAFTVVGEAGRPAERADAPVQEITLEPVPTPWCGGPPPTPAGDDSLFTIAVDGAVDTVSVTDELGLEATITYRGPGRASLIMEHFAEYWLVRDGLVVGRGWPGASDDWWSWAEVGHGFSLPTAGSWTLEECPRGDGSNPTTALSPGEYDVYVSVTPWLSRITRVDGTTAQFANGGADTTVVAEPFSITVEG